MPKPSLQSSRLRLIVLTIILAFLPFTTFAQTEIAGEVSGEWTVDGSPYILVDSTFITADDTLIIHPGVTCNFNEYALLLDGCLIAEGTEDDSIIFTSEEDHALIYNRDEDNNPVLILSYVRITYLGDHDIIILGNFQTFTCTNSIPCKIQIRECDEFYVAENIFTDSFIWLGSDVNEFVFEDNTFINSGIRFDDLVGQTITNQTGIGTNLILIHGYARDVEIENLENFGIMLEGDILANEPTLYDVTVRDCKGSGVFIGFAVGCQVYRYQGGGINIRIANDVLIEDCRFVPSSSIDIEEVRNSDFNNCVFYIAGGTRDIKMYNGCYNMNFTNCTFIRSSYSPARYLISTEANNRSSFINNIVYSTDGLETIFMDEHGGFLWIEYNCFYNVEEYILDNGGRYENNMYADPLLAGGNPFEANLQAISPCIDAGDPDSPDDPDDTRADIGAIFFDQSINNDPIITSPIWAFGGNRQYFQYSATANDDDENNLEITFENLPDWLHVGDNDPSGIRTISGDVSNEQENFTFNINVTDRENLRDTMTVSVDIFPETFLHGDISGVLRNEDSPFRVIDDITVPVDSLLIIEAGVEIYFPNPMRFQDKYNYEFTLNGNLYALGTVENPITLIRMFDEDVIPDNYNPWSGIIAREEIDSVIIRNTNISCSRYGIYISNAEYVELIGNKIEKLNSTSGINVNANRSIIRNNMVLNDSSFDNRAYCGIYSAGNRSLISGNTVCYFGQNGIFCEADTQEICNNILQYNGIPNNIGRVENAGINSSPGVMSFIHHNLIVDNSLGITLFPGDNEDVLIQVVSNTIANCWNGSAIKINTLSNIYIYNNLIHNSPIAFGMPGDSADYDDIRYNLISECDDIFTNWEPVGFGVPDTINGNGDSTDIYGNLIMDAELIEFGSHPFALRSSSLAIDAGNPDSEYDPDNTPCDIGYRSYNHGNVHPEIIDIFPVDQHLRLSFSGSIRFRITGEDEDDDTLYARYLINDEPVSCQFEERLFFTERGVYEVIGELTDGNGVVSTKWTVVVGLTDVEEEEPLTPTEFKLYPAYPNPFNCATNISFDLPIVANPILTIYDITGKRVAREELGQYNAGHHTVTFSSPDLTSGLYVFSLRVTGEEQFIKALYLK
ncbi:right-handed parallel beta-helix repeat-containing protein [bacterium]|nr:right-handed parallel beta-helix repeat-containing protein [bacterium]